MEILAAFLVVFLFAARRSRVAVKLQSALDSRLDGWTANLDALPGSHVPCAIALASAAALFLELAIIRLHGGYVHLFALLKNISLLSCFLGLGVGFIYGRAKRVTFPLQPFILFVQLLFLQYLMSSGSFLKIGNPFSDEQMLGLLTVAGAERAIAIVVVMIVFSLNAVTFMPLGQLIGRLMSHRAGAEAYRYNLWGSIAGIALFISLSYFQIGGAMWIVAYSFMVAPFLLSTRTISLISVFGLFCSAQITQFSFEVNAHKLYSPYQTLTLSYDRSGEATVGTNTMYYQHIWDLSDDAVRARPHLRNNRDYYDFAYRFLPPKSSVLIVGSGTGNDVAAALRSGVEHVTAVEIDPVIAAIGQNLHPEDPYHSLKVSLIVSDARAYLRRASEKVDAVVYGLLDSHALLSGRIGGVRLDSYVYTVEGLREARARLKPGGFLSLSFVEMSPALAKKLYLMLSEAFDGAAPIVFRTTYDVSLTFIAGGTEKLRLDATAHGRFEDVSESIGDPRVIADVSTDDWPYLYMPRKAFPLSYLALWVPILLLSLLPLRPLLRKGGEAWDGTSFFLGAAFMLLETKAFTEMALVWGSTFVVTALVILAILLFAVLSNELVIRRLALSSTAAFFLLIASVAVGYAAARSGYAFTSLSVEALIRPILLTLPIFFAGFCFSRRISSRSADVVMASNLLGAMFGGMLEYTSMVSGFRALYFEVMALYLLAYLCQRRPARAQSA